MPIPDRNGTLLLNIHVIVVKVTVVAGATSVTVAVPGPGLAFYLPMAILAWNANGWWIVSQTEKSCVLEFSGGPATDAEMFILLFH